MLSFVLLSVLVSCALASPALRNMVVHEQIHTAPEGFAAKGPADATQMLNMRIALKQTNIEGLQEKLMAVSDPASAEYGQHLTKEEVRARGCC